MANRLKFKRSHLQQIRWLAFLCGIPGFVAAFWLLIYFDADPKFYATVLILGGGFWLYFFFRLQSKLVQPLQSASNMLSALREGDFSLHPAYQYSNYPLGQLLLEISLLTNVLSSHRMDALEANLLLEKVIEEIDAAVFTFDTKGSIVLSNKVGRVLVAESKDSIQGKSASDLRLATLLTEDGNKTVPFPDPSSQKRFAIRRGKYRVGGQPYQFLILLDVSLNLREEELHAWKSLIRVLSHEINNSMTPIQSIAQSLSSLAARSETNPETKQDLLEGLDIIKNRSASLNRFIEQYARLAKLPPPRLQPVEIKSLLKRVALLSDHMVMQIPDQTTETIIQADPDQLEQALINIIKNAIEAIDPETGRICIHWEIASPYFHLFIEDNGPGIGDTENLFVPFFSTKKGGSGIGLTLSRQILEGHNGTLKIQNKTDATGVRATLSLPILST